MLQIFQYNNKCLQEWVNNELIEKASLDKHLLSFLTNMFYFQVLQLLNDIQIFYYYIQGWHEGLYLHEDLYFRW